MPESYIYIYFVAKKRVNNRRSVIIKARYKHEATTSVIIIHIQIEMMLFSGTRDHRSLSSFNGVFGTGRRRLILAVEKGVMSETPANPDPSALSVRQKRPFYTASHVFDVCLQIQQTGSNRKLRCRMKLQVSWLTQFLLCSICSKTNANHQVCVQVLAGAELQLLAVWRKLRANIPSHKIHRRPDCCLGFSSEHRFSK